MTAQESVFQQVLDRQIDLVNKKKNTIQMRIDFIKDLYALFMSNEGQKFILDHDDVRKMLKIKTNEFMNDLLAENDVVFLDMSREVLMVVENIDIGKK